MLIVDDVLLFPVRGIMFVFREIHNAARQHFTDEAESLRMQLSELYMMLETGRMTEQEFDTQERTLLDRLDKIESRNANSGDGPETEDT